MSKDNGERIFERCGAVLKGHFVLESGEHSETFLEKAHLYRDPVIFEELCRAMTHEVSLRPINIDAVAGPAPIGAVLAQRVAYHLGEVYHKTVVPLFTEKDEEGQHIFRRNFEKDVKGKNVLIVDDVMTDGLSITQFIKAIIYLKGNIAAVAVICNRGSATSGNLFIFPVISLLTMKLKAWSENECPLCRTRVPIYADIGMGREFLKSHPGYPSR